MVPKIGDRERCLGVPSLIDEFAAPPQTMRLEITHLDDDVEGVGDRDQRPEVQIEAIRKRSRHGDIARADPSDSGA
ncbi:hypothetical protein D3C80_2088850 [compost metagenome]